MIVGQEDKPPLDELAHYGVKGMKWGVTHDTPGGGGSGGSNAQPAKKKYTSQDIHQARIVRELQRQAWNDAVNKANAAERAGNTKLADQHMKEVMRLHKEISTSDYGSVAAKTTRGEKIAALLIGGPLGAVYIAANAANSRSMAKAEAEARKAYGVKR